MVDDRQAMSLWRRRPCVQLQEAVLNLDMGVSKESGTLMYNANGR